MLILKISKSKIEYENFDIEISKIDYSGLYVIKLYIWC